MRLISRLVAFTTSLVIVAFFAAPANAAVIEGSAASAAGIRVHANVLGLNLLNLPPTPYAAAPDSSAQNPNDVARQTVGNVRLPADGSLVGDIDVLSVRAARSTGALPGARAEAVVTDLKLLEQAGAPLIHAELIKSVSETKCTGASVASVSAAGSKLAGLRVGTQVFDYVPARNTTIPLVFDGGTPADPSDDRGIRVILNEQTGATSGTGLIVTMIHVLVFDAISPNLVFADIRIAEARSTAFCSLATPPT
ncbi:MAG: choice-of-anchor P family protein, partial [Actinomycetota bacterium]